MMTYYRHQVIVNIHFWPGELKNLKLPTFEKKVYNSFVLDIKKIQLNFQIVAK